MSGGAEEEEEEEEKSSSESSEGGEKDEESRSPAPVGFKVPTFPPPSAMSKRKTTATTATPVDSAPGESFPSSVSFLVRHSSSPHSGLCPSSVSPHLSLPFSCCQRRLLRHSDLSNS